MLVELGAPDGLEQAVAGQDQDLGVRPVLEQLQDLLDGAERLAQPQPRFEHRCRVEETINAATAAPAFEVSLMSLGLRRRSPRDSCCAFGVDRSSPQGRIRRPTSAWRSRWWRNDALPGRPSPATSPTRSRPGSRGLRGW